MKRREVLQWGLLAACQALLPTRADTPGLLAHIQLRQDQGQLWLAEVELENQSDEALNVLFQVGDRPALGIRGLLLSAAGPIALAPVPPEALLEERLTRAGPRRVWRPLPPRGRLALGSYRLKPEKPVMGAQSASFELQVETAGGPVRLKVEDVRLSGS